MVIKSCTWTALQVPNLRSNPPGIKALDKAERMIRLKSCFPTSWLNTKMGVGVEVEWQGNMRHETNFSASPESVIHNYGVMAAFQVVLDLLGPKKSWRFNLAFNPGHILTFTTKAGFWFSHPPSPTHPAHLGFITWPRTDHGQWLLYGQYGQKGPTSKLVVFYFLLQKVAAILSILDPECILRDLGVLRKKWKLKLSICSGICQ